MPDYSNEYPWLIPNGLRKAVTLILPTATIPGVSGDMFISDGHYIVREARESHTVASSSGTVQIEVLTPGQNADDGVDQLTATMSLSGTADTPVKGTVITEPTVINPGDRLGYVLAGTLTSLINGCVTVFLERLRRV